jgi:hypothetical protein
VVFYGASGVERLRGTNVGQLWDTAEGVPEVFEQQMRGYRAHALGISGAQDHPNHVVWVPTETLGWGGEGNAAT